MSMHVSPGFVVFKRGHDMQLAVQASEVSAVVRRGAVTEIVVSGRTFGVDVDFDTVVDAIRKAVAWERPRRRWLG